LSNEYNQSADSHKDQGKYWQKAQSLQHARLAFINTDVLAYPQLARQTL
jgi:hypothetical protein